MLAVHGKICCGYEMTHLADGKTDVRKKLYAINAYRTSNGGFRVISARNEQTIRIHPQSSGMPSIGYLRRPLSVSDIQKANMYSLP